MSTCAEAVPHDEFERSMFDRRKFHRPFLRNADGSMSFYTPAARAWAQVRGITLHQTACRMGENPQRYDTTGAHFVVTRSGKVIRLCDLTKLVWHGHGWSPQGVGIEIDGLYAGLEDDPRTAHDESLATTWDDPSTPFREMPDQVTPHAMESARQLVRWIVAETALHGATIKVLSPHRSAVESRRNDPGQAIWQQVAVPLHAELGLSDGGVGFVIPRSTGRPVPEAWDPRCTGIRY